MLPLDQLNTLFNALNEAQSLAEAEQLTLQWLEKQYGRGAVAYEKPDRPSGQVTVRPTRLNEISPAMVMEAIYPREASLLTNELFVVEGEPGGLDEEDRRLVQAVTDYLQLTMGRLLLDQGIDPLTGLPGRGGLKGELDKMMEAEQTLSVVMLDLDNFGKFNTALTVADGDRLLGEVASLLREEIRMVDRAFRCDGDEFAVLLPGAPLETATRTAERIRAECELRFSDPGMPAMTASIGVSSWPERASDKEELLKTARDAMHASWTIGGNRVCLAPARPHSTTE